MAIPSAPNKHNNLYQSPLKGTVIRLQIMTLHFDIPCRGIFKEIANSWGNVDTQLA